jgi:NRPS condensation-like uncharacterized protein
MICRTSKPVGRLNAFQRVMLQWSELHPYNAIHTYRLAGTLNEPAFRRAVDDAFDHNSLGVAELDPDGVWYRHEETDLQQPVEINRIDGDEPAEDRLATNIVRELNRPFGRPRCQPFRFSVLDADDDSHFISLIYDHWATDSIGARLLMRHVLGRYLNLDIPENAEKLDLYPGTYRDVFSHRLGGIHLAGPMLRSIRSWLANRSTRRVAYTSASQMEVGYAFSQFSPGTVQQVRQFARDNDASVNDVFLAALCRAMAPLLPKRSHSAKSHGMTLGTIVDTRADAEENLGETLGTFLGYYLIRAAGDGKIALGELTQNIAALTRKKKQQRSYLDSAVNFRVAGAIWPRLKPEDRLHFVRRVMPLSAGISNVYLRGTWIDRNAADQILDVRRTVSSGPALPLVISPTTLHDQMNIGVSYRATGFSRSKIETIVSSLTDQLETLGRTTPKQQPLSNRRRLAASTTY